MNKVMDSSEFSRTIKRMAYEIIEKNCGCNNIVIIGIQKNGIHLANRLAELISKLEDVKINVGSINTSLYRDDYDTRIAKTIAPSEIDFDLNNKNIILVDDVMFTGRTTRAAIEAIFDLGRPAKIQLAVFVDRKQRELPYCADFIGKVIPVSKRETINVTWKENDTEDAVYINKIN